MPDINRVRDFISMVVDEKHVEAITEFYHDDATMQENLNLPRKGKDNLISYEIDSHKKFKSMETFPPKSILIDGDNVAINWTFEIIDPLGQRRRLEEVSLQKWEADKILEERFFYDSAKAWHLVE